MTPESAEQFNKVLETLLRGPAGAIIVLGVVVIVALVISIVERK